MQSTSQSGSRTIRVFISSTFRDMQEERDYLVKFAFPELRKRCKKRYVEFIDVDLRWGVTEEQSERGEVLPICLAEIENCRPYFIGILGERYGYVPESLPSEIVSDQPWLNEDRDRSVTELEILHGVLRNDEMVTRGFFYFRDSSYINKVPEDQRKNFITESPLARKKLDLLKKSIRQSGHAVRENYADPKALSDMVLRDLWGAIDKDFPEGSEPDFLKRIEEEQEAFAYSLSRVYIKSEEAFVKIDMHIKSEDPPLIVLGEQGVGKSALLANWGLKYQNDHPEDFLFFHFIGSSPKSSDSFIMIARLMAEIQNRYGFEDEVFNSTAKMQAAVPLYLARTTPDKGRIVIVLDGLDQLEDRGNALELGWLPENFPPHVRVVVSTNAGKSLDALKRRCWPIIHVDGLNHDQRCQLVTTYLGQYRKSLSEARLDRIVSSDNAGTPLFLCALLEELRVYGIHENLDERIEYYLSSKTTDVLFSRILGRYEADYEVDRPGLVRDVMSYVWAARNGLAESELLELLGQEGKPMPAAYWTPMYLACGHALVNRSGLLTFAHDYIRQAVKKRFVTSDEIRLDIHRYLANYFAEKGLDDNRALTEVPWQLLESKQWDRLHYCITYHAVLIRWMEVTEFYDLWRYWQELHANTDLRASESYSWLKNYNPTVNIIISPILIGLIGQESKVAALSYCQSFVRCCKEIGDQLKIAMALCLLAEIHISCAEIIAANTVLQEASEICENIKHPYTTVYCTKLRGEVASRVGDLKEALNIFNIQEQLCRKYDFKVLLCDCLLQKGILMMALDDSKNAMLAFKDSERVSRTSGCHPGLAASLLRQAEIVYVEQPASALLLLNEAREVTIKFGLSDILIRIDTLKERININLNSDDNSFELTNKNNNEDKKEEIMTEAPTVTGEEKIGMRIAIMCSMANIISYLMILVAVVGIIFSLFKDFHEWQVYSTVGGVIGFVVFKYIYSVLKNALDKGNF